MNSSANQQTYGGPGWGNPGWGNNQAGQAGGQTGAWNPPPFWHPAGMSRPVGIAAMVLGFIFFWPIGLAILAALWATGRIGCRGRRGWAMSAPMGPYNDSQGPRSGSPPWAGLANWCGGERAPPSSGNRAFDEYRTETIRRLEDEQKEFNGFLDRLRFAKDKAEFDQFMAERRQGPVPPSPDHQEPGHG